LQKTVDIINKGFYIRALSAGTVTWAARNVYMPRRPSPARSAVLYRPWDCPPVVLSGFFLSCRRWRRRVVVHLPEEVRDLSQGTAVSL